MKNTLNAITLLLALVSPSVSLPNVLIDVSVMNSASGVITTANISGSIDTSTLTLRELSPVSADLEGTGIGVGQYPNSNTNIAGIYRGESGAFSVVYNGLMGQSGPVTTAQSNVQATSSAADGINSGFGFDNQYIYLGSNYISGSPIGIRMDFFGKTPSDLGFAAGTRSWTIGSNVINLRVANAVLPNPLRAASVTPANIPIGSQVTLSTIGGYAGGAVTFSVSTSRMGSGALVCSISGNVLTASGGAGSCVITATQEASANYAGSTTTFRISVGDASPIPALSEWAQLMLGLLLISQVGWHFHRQREC